MVLLSFRVCIETVPALKYIEWELGQLRPLAQERKSLPWLVKTVPSTKLQFTNWRIEPAPPFSDLGSPDVVDKAELLALALLR